MTPAVRKNLAAETESENNAGKYPSFYRALLDRNRQLISSQLLEVNPIDPLGIARKIGAALSLSI